MPPYTRRRTAGAHSYTADELAHRYARLDEQGLRCDEINRRCSQTAVVELTTYTVNPTTKVRNSEELTTRKVCSRHRLKYEQSPIYEIARKRRLPPLR